MVLTPWFPNAPGGREGNFIHDSTVSVAQRGISMDVLVTRPWVPKRLASLRRDHLEGHFDPTSFPRFSSVRLVHYPSIPRNHIWQVSEWFHNARIHGVLEAMAKRGQAALIHAHTEGEAQVSVEVGRKLGLPVVVTIHGINVGRRYFDDPERRRRFRVALARADRIVLVGEPLRQYFKDIVGSDDKFRVVHNGVEVPPFSSRTVLADDGAIRLISVSNLNEGKGIDLVLRALAAAHGQGFTGWTYVVVGDGPEMETLVALAASLGLSSKVRFCGSRPHAEIYHLLGNADVFVLPSYREAFGIAYLEAMAAGLLTIGVRGQGPSAFIEHERTGLLVEPRSVSDLAKQLVVIEQDREHMRTIAEAGADHVRANFTWDAHARHLLDVYEEVLRG